MSLKDRVDRLSDAAGQDECEECRNPGPVKLYIEGLAGVPDPGPRYCSRCGRDLGVSLTVVYAGE